MSTATPANRRCTICGYVVAGAQPPPHCPECGAIASMFEPTDEPPHGIPHNPFQPHDPSGGGGAVVGPGGGGCLDTD